MTLTQHVFLCFGKDLPGIFPEGTAVMSHLAPVCGSELLAEEQFAAKRGASQYADQQLGACAPCLKAPEKPLFFETFSLLGT